MFRSSLFPLVLCLGLIGFAQTKDDIRSLEPGQTVVREIAGAESHVYPIKLSAGQLMRVVAVHRGIDIVLELADPGGKEVWKADFSRNFGGQESLSFEAVVPGEYRLMLRPSSRTAPKGIFDLRLELKTSATADDKKRINAERLLMEGLESTRLSNHQTGIDKALQVLPLWRELSDQYWEADTLSLLGSAHNSTRKFDQAAEYYNQCLLLRRQIKDRAGESNTLSDLGVVSSGQNKHDQSLAYATQALEIKRELKDRAGEARVLNVMANAAYQFGRFAQVITYSDQMLGIYQALGDRTGIGDAYNLKGRCHFNLNQADDAVSNYEKALASYREAKNRRSEGVALHNLALIRHRLRQYDDALKLYEQSLAIKRELKDRLNEGATLSSIGNMFTNMGEYERALKYLDEALSISRELKDPASEVTALINIATQHQSLGQNEKALEISETVLSIARSLKIPLLLNKAYKNLESVAYRQGLYEKAIESQEELLVFDRETKNLQAETYDLISMAGNYRNLGRYDRAREILQQAHALSRGDKSPKSEGYVLANIGIVYTVEGNYREAVGYHERAVAIFREAKEPVSEARSLINLGECFLKLGRPQESIAVTAQALSLVRGVKDRDGESIALGNLGAAYNASGQFAKADESLSQALEIAREIRKPERYREALNQLARLERNQGNLAKASEYLEQSLKSLEKSRSEIYSPQSRAAFLAAEQESLQLYIDLLMLRRRTEPGMEALAVEASERSRARVFLELLGEARIDLRQDVDAALVAQEQALGKKVNTWAQRLDQARKPELVSRLKLELGQFESDLDRTQAAIRKASPQYAALTQPQPLKLSEIQQQLDAGTLLLEYALGVERSYLWAITKDSVTSYELPKGEQIKQNALQVYELLTARSTRKRGESALERRDRITQAEAKLPSAAQSLSQILLAPIAAQLGNKRLVIVADGALQYIPFGMLPEPVAGGRWPVASGQWSEAGKNQQPLIVNHEVVNLPSASALAIHRTELAHRELAPKMLAVIADPVFDRTDARFKSLGSEARNREQAQATIAFNDVRSIEHLAEKPDARTDATTRTLVIPRLPFTRQEADQLLTLAPKPSSFRAMDFEASRETVLKGGLSQYRYVHFATHGLLDSERPGLSSLVLSMVDARGKAQDGFLRANDIYNLKLPAELVVLSACQTGLGKEVKGEGLVGLTRGFMYAGAARVVVSLWNVNDKATADLMSKFYEKMLRHGERPAAALRAAQVEMWKQKQWQSPYYWAAFTMQGEWR